MKRERIAIDVDEVLFPFLDEFIQYHNNKYGTSLTRDQVDNYEFSKALKLDIPATVQRIYNFHEHLGNKTVEPFEASKEAIAKLSKKYDLSIVTARHPKFEDMTTEWLKRHYGDIFKNINHIGFAPIMEKARTKAEVCLEIKAIALIDDSVDHILGCSAVGIDGILFGDYPWNQYNSLPPNVTRCINWGEVLRHFKLQ